MNIIDTKELEKLMTKEEVFDEDLFIFLKEKLQASDISDYIVEALERKSNTLFYDYDPLDQLDQTILNNKINHIRELENSNTSKTDILKIAMVIFKTKE